MLSIIDHLTQISGADETLLATCVTLNPKFQHRSITLTAGLLELASSTNVVLAATDLRLVVVATGVGGAPRSHYEISYTGLELVGHGKHDVTLRWVEGEATFKGAAKIMLPQLVDALATQSRPNG